jgi:hypothetical protein
MRTLSASDSAVIAGSEIAQHVRVKVKDSGGTYRDLSSYPGYNAVREVTWEQSLGDPHTVATVQLLREQDELSITPLMTGSALNHAFDPAAAYGALLAVGREITIEVATVAGDTALADVASGAWLAVFHGVVDTIETGKNALVLSCRDYAATIQDRFIEIERVYGLLTYGGTHRGLRIWGPGETYTAGEFVIPTDGARSTSPFAYEVTTGGTTAAAIEPAWPTSGTVVDNTVTYTYRGILNNGGYSVENVIQAILNDNGLSAFTLYTPSSPGWAIKQFIVARQGVLTCIRDLALQIGWDIRWKYDEGTSAWRLTLWEPVRTSPTVQATFTADQYSEISEAKSDIADVRNVVRVIYSDSEHPQSDGSFPRKYVESSDSASIALFGRRFMEISEASTSNIDTATEAGTLTATCLADLATPLLNLGVVLPFAYPWAEAGDYYTFVANTRVFDADQSLAIERVSHSTRGVGKLQTAFALRGKPGLSPHRWLARETRAGNEMHALKGFQGTSGIALNPHASIGGMALEILAGTGGTSPAPSLAKLPDEYEIHVSTTPGFTPAAATLQAVTQGRSVVLPTLTPGTLYYSRVVPRTRNASKVVAGTPSTEVSFRAAQAQAQHINPQLDTSRKPLNGGFETYFDATGLPDHWKTITGGAGISTQTDSNGVSGKRYLKIHQQSAGTDVELDSAQFTVTAGVSYRLALRYKTSATVPTSLIECFVSWFDETALPESVSTGLLSVDVPIAVDAPSTSWTTVQGFITAPAGARIASVGLYVAGGATGLDFYVDEVVMDTTPSLNMPKASGEGIFVAGTYPWGDLIGDVSPKTTGAGAATLAAFRGGAYRGWFYGAGDLCDMLFHVPHDYAPGTDLYLHLHWAHNGTAISGSLVVTFGVTYAKGHNQANFPAEVAPVLTVSTPNIGTIPQYRHRVDELQLSAASPSGTQLSTGSIEPDGLILVGLTATTIPTITGGSTNKPCFFTCDIHYQSTGIGTKNKSPDFYT